MPPVFDLSLVLLVVLVLLVLVVVLLVLIVVLVVILRHATYLLTDFWVPQS